MEKYKQTKRFENFVRLAVVFLVVLVCVATFSFIKLGNARRKNEEYDLLIAELTAENERIEASVTERQSPEYLEKYVREVMGWVKGDETHIEFEK